MRERFDIAVVGGGIAGLLAALAFARQGRSVLCVDPRPADQDALDPSSDLRTTAYLQPGRDFLESLGIWEDLAGEAQALRVMRIKDLAKGGPGDAKDFASDDISERPFGWNVANWRMRAVLLQRARNTPGLDFRPETALAALTARTEEALLTLSDGAQAGVRLVVGADGRDSFVRNCLGIRVRRHAFGQSALTFAVNHDTPHHNISTEVHRSGGPFTLVPLPDHAGRPCSAVVWMERGVEAERLMGLSEESFNAEATERSGGVNGDLMLATSRSRWPIISQLADRLTGARSALIAEAAHVMPPIGAQGLNMSLRDIAKLVELTAPAEDPGARAILRRYARARWPDMALRIGGISALNTISMAGDPGMTRARASGLELFHGVAPIRKTLMRLGLGAA
ncbi:MAG: FAD-dependent oxidoreductase [Pseudomonadota bacterium]